MKKYLGYLIATFITFSACNLTQDVEIELPSYESQLAVEVYLIPGQPFSALLSNTSSYFDLFPTDIENFLDDLLVEDATITINYDGKTVALENQLFFNPFTGKIFNYFANEIVPEDYTGTFDLEITTDDGQTITGQTVIPAKITIDSITVERNEIQDTLYRSLTYFQDDPTQENFYRRILALNQPDSVEFDFTFSDRLSDSTTIATGSGFDYVVGDTLISTVMNITPDYYDFINSLRAAVDANGNPFAQPSTILSNVEGNADPIGVFTGFHLVQGIQIINE